MNAPGPRQTALEIVQAAIPDADERLADFILWERTPFPAGAVSARGLYKAASRLRRASANGLVLCDFCDRVAMLGSPLSICARCRDALS